MLLAIAAVMSAAAASDSGLDAQLAPVFSDPPSVSLKAIERTAQGLEEPDRSAFLIVGLEMVGSPRERIARFARRLTGRREAVAAQRAMTCSLADALAQEGDEVAAEALLELWPAGGTDLDRADLASARARIALGRHRLAEVRTQVTAGAAALKLAVPDGAYEDWRSRLVRRRLASIERLLEADTALEVGGAAYVAWIQADQATTREAYGRVSDVDGDPLFAAAARLESARLALGAGEPRDALRFLDDQPLMRGSLAAPAQILRGDALVHSGKLAEAKVAYEAALSALSQPAPLDLAPRLREALLPDQPLHRLVGWGFPEWGARPAGKILAPGLSPWVAAYHRYQAVVRLSVLVHLAGDPATAATLARSLVMFDDVDRKMSEATRGAGGQVLACTFDEGACIIPLDSFDGLPLTTRARVLMGVAFYQVYDWVQCSAWLGEAMERTPGWTPLAKDGATALRACAEQMRPGHHPQALALARHVKLKRGGTPTWAYYRARQVEFEIHQTNPQNYPAAMACMQEVLDLAPGTWFASQALLYQATYSGMHDRPLAKRLFRAWADANPSDPKIQKQAADAIDRLDHPENP